jgi:hypothetical protein
MQRARKLGPFSEQQPTVAPLRVTTFYPSMWERMRAWTQRTLTEETVAEVIFGTATIFLVTVLFVSFTRALAHYTIIPLP